MTTPVRSSALTARQTQVLDGIIAGKTNAQIGRDLFIAEDTVRAHCERIYRRLGVANRIGAVVDALRPTGGA